MFDWFKPKEKPGAAIVGHEVYVNVHGQDIPRRIARNRERAVRVDLALTALRLRDQEMPAVALKIKLLEKEARLLAILNEKVEV